MLNWILLLQFFACISLCSRVENVRNMASELVYENWCKLDVRQLELSKQPEISYMHLHTFNGCTCCTLTPYVTYHCHCFHFISVSLPIKCDSNWSYTHPTWRISAKSELSERQATTASQCIPLNWALKISLPIQEPLCGHSLCRTHLMYADPPKLPLVHLPWLLFWWWAEQLAPAMISSPLWCMWSLMRP